MFPPQSRMQGGMSEFEERLSRVVVKAKLRMAKVETLTETSLKRMHLQFERKVKVNRELRIKFLGCIGQCFYVRCPLRTK